MALEKLTAWKNRKFAPGSRPKNDVIVKWIKDGLYYGEQVGNRGDWYIDEYRDPATAPTTKIPIKQKFEPPQGLLPESLQILQQVANQ